MAPVVLYDACVLYPAPLRDLLMRLALARCRRLMNEHVPDSLVVGYEPLIESVTLPDADDRHVLAAAIHGGAGLIVTFNLSDFPAPVLAGYSIEAMHPDEFVTSLWEESPDAVLDAVRRQRESLKNPPRTADELLATLGQCGLVETVARLRAHAVGL